MVVQLSSSNTIGVMMEKMNFPQKTTHHPFFGPEGSSYGHKRVVWSTWTPTRKVDMIQTFPDRFEARMTPCYAILAWTKGNLISLGVFGLVFWAWGWPLWPQMCAFLKVYFVLYKLSGCAAFQLKYFRSYDREIEFSPKNHPPPIWRRRVGDGRYFPHSYQSEIFWGFLNIYFQIPCAPAKQSDEMMLVGPTLMYTALLNFHC